MLIHINDKMAFICPQRAGHTTAWKFFGEESSNGFRGNAKIFEWQNSNKQKVAVIRNPFDRYVSGLATDLQYSNWETVKPGYKHTDPFLYLVADYDFKYISFENFGRYFGVKKYGWDAEYDLKKPGFCEYPKMVSDEFEIFENILKEKKELNLDEWNDLCN